MIEKIISCPRLPTFPAVATELLEMTRDPDVSMNEIARLIKSDQGLSGRVLKTVNSSFYGLSQRCTTIDRALGFLGMKAIKSLVLGFSMVKVSRGASQDGGFDMTEYWRRTIAAAAGARHIALATRACDPDEAFTAGLFQDMGMLAAYVAVPEEYGHALESAPMGHSQLPEHERSVLGFDHAEVGAALADKWRLSDIVSTCVRFHHEPEKADEASQPMVKVVALGRLASEVIVSENMAQPLADLMFAANQWFSRDKDEVESLLDQITSATNDLAEVLDQNIGEIPDVQEILTRANEQLVEQQILAQRETEQLQQKADSLEMQTLTDTLTGAANRKRFDSEIDNQFAAAQKQGRPLTVLFVDADKFKSVNDTHGHQAGDAVLVELSRRMMHVAGGRGIVCRYGGEEFAIILPDADRVEGAEFAESVRLAIADEPFDLSGVDGAPPTLPIRVSIGVSATDPDQPQRHSSAQQLVLEADKGVYAAKENGRNRVCVYGIHVENDSGDDPASPQSSSGDDPQASAVSAPPAPTAAASGSGQRVLVAIVDGDPLASAYLHQQLTQTPGVQVLLLRNCAQAKELIRRSEQQAQIRPQVFICERQFTDGSGEDIVTAVKNAGWLSDTATYVLASNLSTSEAAAFGSAGAAGAFLKVDIVKDLAGWIGSILPATQSRISAA